MSNENEYSRMLEQIELFESGKLNLPSLINNLDAHLGMIRDENPTWLQAFRGEWWELEQLYAYALDQKRNGIINDIYSFIAEAKNQNDVHDALENMKLLLSERKAANP